MNDLKALVAKVREADEVYFKGAFNGFAEEDEKQAWEAKCKARQDLRSSISVATGVSIDDLKELTRT